MSQLRQALPDLNDPTTSIEKNGEIMAIMPYEFDTVMMAVQLNQGNNRSISSRRPHLEGDINDGVNCCLIVQMDIRLALNGDDDVADQTSTHSSIGPQRLDTQDFRDDGFGSDLLNLDRRGGRLEGSLGLDPFDLGPFIYGSQSGGQGVTEGMEV